MGKFGCQEQNKAAAYLSVLVHPLNYVHVHIVDKVCHLRHVFDNSHQMGWYMAILNKTLPTIVKVLLKHIRIIVKTLL